MAFTDPHDWTVNEVVTATLLDSNLKDNFLAVHHPVHVENTSIAISNTAVETSLFSTAPVIAANAMGTSGWVRVTLWGTYIYNAGTRTLTWRTKFGGVTQITSTWAAASASATVTSWRMDIDMLNDGATNSQVIFNYLLAPAPGGGGGFSQNTSMEIHSILTAAVDTTANQTFDVTVQWNAADVNTTWTKVVSRVMLMQG